MAAIVEPHRFTHPHPRAELCLVPGAALGPPLRSRPGPGPLAPVVWAALVVVAVVLAAAGAVVVGRGGLAAAAPAPPAAASVTSNAGSPDRALTVTVGPGDTLWSIARRAQPDGDVRPLVDRLVVEHGPAPLQPGERLAITW